jgi:hypothetical protein
MPIIYYIVFFVFQQKFITDRAPGVLTPKFAGELFRELFVDNFLVSDFNWSDRLDKIALKSSLLVTQVLQRKYTYIYILYRVEQFFQTLFKNRRSKIC